MRTAALRRLVVMGLVALTGACEMDLSTGGPLLRGLPPAFQVVEVDPTAGATEVALNQPLSVRFSQYLDPDSFTYFNALEVRSGAGLGSRGFVRYDMVDRRLTFFLTRDLRPQLIYTLAVNPETVRSLSGEALPAELSVRFQTAAEGTVEQDRVLEPLSYAEEIAPIWERHCGSCHSGESGVPPTLSASGLVSRASAQLAGRLWVEPFDASRSYLMHKILPDYGDRRYTVMPPPWSDEEPLTVDELRLVEQWIDTGAAP